MPTDPTYGPERVTTCLLCKKGFPLNSIGEHYGSQRHGMIENTRCADRLYDPEEAQRDLLYLEGCASIFREESEGGKEFRAVVKQIAAYIRELEAFKKKYAYMDFLPSKLDGHATHECWCHQGMNVSREINCYCRCHKERR